MGVNDIKHSEEISIFKNLMKRKHENEDDVDLARLRDNLHEQYKNKYTDHDSDADDE